MSQFAHLKPPPNPSERRGVQLVQRRISKEIIANLQQNRTSPPLEGLGEASSANRALPLSGELEGAGGFFYFLN